MFVTRYIFCVSGLQIKVLLGHRVVQVACGSRDAQTLALTDEGKNIVQRMGMLVWEYVLYGKITCTVY